MIVTQSSGEVSRFEFVVSIYPLRECFVDNSLIKIESEVSIQLSRIHSNIMSVDCNIAPYDDYLSLTVSREV